MKISASAREIGINIPTREADSASEWSDPKTRPIASTTASPIRRIVTSLRWLTGSLADLNYGRRRLTLSRSVHVASDQPWAPNGHPRTCHFPGGVWRDSLLLSFWRLTRWVDGRGRATHTPGFLTI